MHELPRVRAHDIIVDYAAYGKHHFTFSEFRENLNGTAAAARQALSRLAKKGEIASPSRGFYVILPPEFRHIGCLPADEFIPALMEYRNMPYYVGLLSAAQYFGAAHQRPQEFQVVLAKNRNEIVCGNVKVVFLARKNLHAVPTVRFNNPRGSIVVSSIEATVFDLVGYMHRAGGVDRVAGLLSELADDLDPVRLVEASRSVPIRWAQRSGYLLESIGAEEKVTLLKRNLRGRARNFTRLIPSISGNRARRANDWRVLVNVDVEPEI